MGVTIKNVGNMLKKLQAYTGILFAVFVLFHLFNTWLAAFGPQVYDSVQQSLRVVYQFAPVEALLLGALAVHAVVGVMRIAQEPKRNLSTRAKFHRYAGFFLLLVIGGHILAVRGASWFYDIYPGFVGLAFSLEYVPLYFYPYYFLLGVAGFYHCVNGLTIAGTRLGIRLLPPLFPKVAQQDAQKQMLGMTLIASLLMVVALLGFSGIWTDIGEPMNSDFAKLALDLLADVQK